MARPTRTPLRAEPLEDRVVPALTFFQATGTAASDVSDAVNQFRSILGDLNPNLPGSVGGGRREINWDGVPAALAAPNNLPADFFNTTSPRGVVLSTPGTGFQVSGNTADAGTGQPAVRFDNLNATYPTLFNAFSAQRLFTPVGSNVTDVTFFVPGTTTPAVTRAFGVVFADVDRAGTTILQFFDTAGNSLFGGAVSPTFPATNGGFSFLGAFDNATASIARVRITTGNTAVGADEAGSTDIVVMDDFIYAEPVAAPAAPTIGDIPDQTAAGPLAPVSFTVGDLNTPAGQLALSAASSDPALVPVGNIGFGGTGATRSVLVVPAAGRSGTATITVTVTDADGQTATDTFAVTIPPLPPTTLLPRPVNGDRFAVATGPGVPVRVTVFTPDGTARITLAPFGEFAGGATVATADLSGDGIDDVVVGAGPGGGPHVKVFDGSTGAELRSFFALAGGFAGGVFVGAGDVTRDGIADIVVGAGPGGGPHVQVFDGATGAVARSFFAFDRAFAGGVSVRAGDIDGDGAADVVVGAGPGGAPHVKVFAGAGGAELQSFFAGPADDRSGVLVGVGNFDPASPRPEIVASVGGRVRVFGPPAGAGVAALLPYIEQDSFTPFGAGIPAAPAAIRLDDGIIAILIGAVGKAAPRVQIIDGTSNTVRGNFFAFDPAFTGGAFVG